MKRSFKFLGEEVASANRDRIYVVPVPIEWSTSYLSGTVFAPERILSSSRQIELYNSSLDVDLEGAGIVTIEDELKNEKKLKDWVAKNRKILLDALPCFIGGEHSITPWIIDSLDLENIGIVWFDAHADMRESYEGNTQSHACSARNSLKFGPMVQIGVRSYSIEEKKFIETRGDLKTFRKFDVEFTKAIVSLPEKVYLSFDFDAVDPSLIPAVGTPEPDGLSWQEVISAFEFVFSNKQVLAMDFVELCPRDGDETSNFVSAKIVYEAISCYLKFQQ